MAAEVAVATPLESTDGFDTFVATRAKALWRSAWLLTGDPHRAEDLVQTALAKAYPHFGRLGDAGAFEAYLRTTMHHTYLSWWRRRWTGEVPASVDREQATADPDVGLRRDIARALAELPRAQRAVVVLTYVEDRTQAQIAELLGISVGTVKSHLSRALAKLRVSPRLTEGDAG